MLEKNGRKMEGRLASPYREMAERGITKENWLDHLNEMSDEEITAMLNLQPHRKRLDEERAAQPSLSDRERAESLKYFGG